MEDEFDVPMFNVQTDGLHVPSNTVFEKSVTFLGPVFGLNLGGSFTIDGGGAAPTVSHILRIDLGGAN